MASNPFPAPKPPSDEEKQAHVKMQEQYGHAAALLDNVDFKWFLRECLEPKIEEQQAAINDIATNPEKTTFAKHMRAMLVEVRDFTMIKMETARDSLKTWNT